MRGLDHELGQGHVVDIQRALSIDDAVEVQSIFVQLGSRNTDVQVEVDLRQVEQDI